MQCKKFIGAWLLQTCKFYCSKPVHIYKECILNLKSHLCASEQLLETVQITLCTFRITNIRGSKAAYDSSVCMYSTQILVCPKIQHYIIKGNIWQYFEKPALNYSIIIERKQYLLIVSKLTENKSYGLKCLFFLTFHPEWNRQLQ